MDAFRDITGASPDVAQRLLSIADGNLESAIQLFFEHPELSQAASTPPVPAASTRPSIGRQDTDGIIHLDSDDDGEADGDDDVVAGMARVAQEEEDAAMAQRIQQEMYAESGGVGASEDGVRSPIARRTETLVGGPDDLYDEGADHITQFLSQSRAMQNSRPNPFNQNIWSDRSGPQPSSAIPSAATSSNVSSFQPGTRAHRLAELFRPPFELISSLSWDAAREDGKERRRWLMVNLQDMSDFHCQALNRDVWRDEAVRDLVKENFIFLQWPREDPRAASYVAFYMAGDHADNPDNFPHVSIVDPRTGEQVKVWSGQPFPPPAEFHAELVEFLDRYSLSGRKNPVANAAVKRTPKVDVERMTEEEMLELALQNSLNPDGSSSSASRANLSDPDELTKAAATSAPGQRQDDPSRTATPGVDRTLGEGVGGPTPSQLQDPPQQQPSQETSSHSALFAAISGTSPHDEPANDPATTTRIQFKHSGGRVIRRFRLSDPVRRVYEWLKAEPIAETPAGAEFELKRMPQGQDLIEDLDMTVEQAGLRQGTLMVEFISE